jgi:hypothetical protein
LAIVKIRLWSPGVCRQVFQELRPGRAEKAGAALTAGWLVSDRR